MSLQVVYTDAEILLLYVSLHTGFAKDTSII